MAERHEQERVVTLAQAGKRPCPLCGRPASPRHRPFCSPRCKDLDLARWLGGSYRVPTDEQPDEEGSHPPAESEEDG